MKVTEHDAHFLALLRDPEPGVRASAALAIGGLKISDGFDQLIHLLKDPMENVSVRRSAAIALGSFGNNKACEDLLTVIEFADTNAENFGYDIIGAITVLDKEAVFFSRVIRLLKHDNFNIRSAAAQYFRKHLVPRAIPELISALRDEEESPANAAGEALQEYVDLLTSEQEGNIIQFVDAYLQEYKDSGQTHDNPMWRGYPFYGLKRLLAEKAGRGDILYCSCQEGKRKNMRKTHWCHGKHTGEVPFI